MAPLPQCGKPLPDGGFDPATLTVHIGVLLYPDEVAAIDARIQAMNAVISAAAAANGFKYFDFYALGTDLIANGRTYGGITITKKFVTGGMFAYGEAVHMSNIGYTILADELVLFINASYNSSFPRPNMATALFTKDVPAPGTPALVEPSPESVLFTEESWRRIFEVYPLQSSEYTLVFPGEESVGRAPVQRTEPRAHPTVNRKPRVDN